MPAKTPTPQGISALLRKAGFERSRPRPGALSVPTEGFTVSGQLFGRVRVEHKTGYDRGPNADKRRDEALTRYAETVTNAGYGVERDELWHGLLVTSTSPTPSTGEE